MEPGNKYYDLENFEFINKQDNRLLRRYKGLNKRKNYSLAGSAVSTGLAGLTAYLGWGQETSDLFANPYFLASGISTLGSIAGTAVNIKRYTQHKSKIEEIDKEIDSNLKHSRDELLEKAKNLPLRGIEKHLENKVKNSD